MRVNSLLSKPAFNSKIKSQNTTDKEKWLGYLAGPAGAWQYLCRWYYTDLA